MSTDSSPAVKTVLFAVVLLGAVFAATMWWEKHYEIQLNPKADMTPPAIDFAKKMHKARVAWCHQWADSDKLAECLSHSEETLRLEVEGF